MFDAVVFKVAIELPGNVEMCPAGKCFLHFDHLLTHLPGFRTPKANHKILVNVLFNVEQTKIEKV